jgi:hypothetical protein
VGKTTWATNITKPELTKVIAFEGEQKGVIPALVTVKDVMKDYDPFDPETVYKARESAMKELSAMKKLASKGELRVLVVDGLNILHEAGQAWSMEKSPNSQQQRAVIEQSITRPIMLSLKRLDCLVIVTAHEASRYERDGSGGADSKPIGVQAAIGGGGLRDKLGSYVDDIWQNGKTRRFCTQGNGEGADAKSRLKDADGNPLLADKNVLAPDAAKALRLYMGWTVAAPQ